MSSTYMNKYSVIILAKKKTSIFEDITGFLKPKTRYLFKSIESMTSVDTYWGG